MAEVRLQADVKETQDSQELVHEGITKRRVDRRSNKEILNGLQ